MKFCSECGTPVIVTVPEDDSLPRHVCPACHTIHYQNPRLITGTLPTYQGKIMLCKRGIEPRAGYWTLPGGFMENGETVAEGALRETWEESLTSPALGQLLSMVSIPQINQVHCFYLARLPTPEFTLTPESVEIDFFSPSEIPWEDLAFRSVISTLKHYCEHQEALEAGQAVPLLDTQLGPLPTTL